MLSTKLQEVVGTVEKQENTYVNWKIKWRSIRSQWLCPIPRNYYVHGEQGSGFISSCWFLKIHGITAWQFVSETERVRERVSRSFWTILLKNQACPIRDARTSSPNDASRAVSGREGGRGGWMDRPQDGVTNNMELISVFPQLCNLCKHLTNTQCSKYTGGFN